MDVSFISITKVLPAIKNCVPKNSKYAVLLKPQFEALNHEIPKGGVIHDEAIIQIIVERCKTAVEALGFTIINTCESQVKGTKGNQEFLLYLMSNI
jgi:23S rRNA (cytidine1920-2'-O)/16S rRNA (cytidine1409-2'-O)-methyltransferase